MAKPITQKFENLAIEVETDPVGAPGTFVKVCGMIDANVTRTANIDTAEVPASCDDEILPLSVEKQVRSIDVSVSGTGVYAAGSDAWLKKWFYSGQPLNVRITNEKALSGEAMVETAPALLANLSNGRQKGQKVSAEVEFQMDGVPVLTNAA